MDSSPSPSTAATQQQIAIFPTICRWWKESASIEGRLRATRRLLSVLWEFVCDSTPERLRARYGDADYDWDHRVNTTSGAVSWRDRLLGQFHSAYQPTESAAFHEMLDTLQQHASIDLCEFTFLDLGSGKGRTLLMASDYPFRRIVGVELLPSLHQIAEQNLLKYKSDSQKCFSLQSICADATTFPFPAEPLVLYLFNPFPESGMRRVAANLEQFLRLHNRSVFVLYHNPLLDYVFGESHKLKKISSTLQYSMWSSY